MLVPALYILLLAVELILAFSIFIYITSLLYSSFKGAPYVPTKKQNVEEVLKNAPLKKGQRFIELGSGDGRVVRLAVEKFGVSGIGVDINPLLTLIAKWRHRSVKKRLIFETSDIYRTPLSSYDVIYLFLMPEMLVKLKEKIAEEAKKGTIIISHGFKIAGWDKKITHTLPRKPFPTYYYKV